MASVVHVENGSIGKALAAFALPVLASQALQELYNATDCMVVGHFAGENALAAAGIAGMLLSVLINFFIGFSSGISVVTSRLFGAYDYARLRRTMRAVFRLTIFAGLALSVLGGGMAEPLLRLLRCPAEVLSPAGTYLRICALGIPAQLLYNVGTAVLRSLGNTRSPLRCYGLSCLCNLGLDGLLVIVFHKGVPGAAAATLVSQWLLAGMLLRRLYKLEDCCALRMRGPGLSPAELGQILYSGIPAGMQALFMSISSLLIQTVINSFGPDAMAGMTLYAKLEGCLYLPTFAYGIALTSFVGQNLGAGHMDRVRRAVEMSLRFMWISVFPLSLLISLASPVLLRLFTPEIGILRNAREAVVFNLPFYVIYAVNQVYLGAIKGLGNTVYPMICTLLCYSVFRVVWCRVFIGIFASMRVVYLSYDVSFFLMLLLLAPMYRKLSRQAG